MSDEQLGLCPSCEGVGQVGARCKKRVCKRRGYHYVPGEFAAPSDDEPDPLVGKKIADYLVVDLVGSGGFGQVYLALQMPIRLKAALKLLDMRRVPPQMTKTVTEKFATEAAALAALSHPNVVRLLQYGEYDGSPYLVMEYLPDGETLGGEILRRARRATSFSLAEFREIFSQLLDGVAAAHAASIVHRDLKPDNVMLQTALGRGLNLRLLDFGLAKFIAYGDTTKHTLGTPQYMAPEQFGNANIGPWTDLYAVSVMAFELLTGACPFGNDDYHKILKRKLDLSYDVNHIMSECGLPAPLEALLRDGMARWPEERISDAVTFKSRLLEALDAVASLPGWAELPPLAALLDPEDRRELSERPTRAAHPQAVDARGRGVSSEDAYHRFLQRERRRLDSEAERLETLERRRSGELPPVDSGETDTE